MKQRCRGGIPHVSLRLAAISCTDERGLCVWWRLVCGVVGEGGRRGVLVTRAVVLPAVLNPFVVAVFAAAAVGGFRIAQSRYLVGQLRHQEGAGGVGRVQVVLAGHVPVPHHVFAQYAERETEVVSLAARLTVPLRHPASFPRETATAAPRRVGPANRLPMGDLQVHLDQPLPANALPER